MSNIVFLIGTSCAGKSCCAARLFPNHVHLSMGRYQDKLLEEHEAESGSPYISNPACRRLLMRASELLLADALKHIGAGEPVVIEGTFYKAKRRIAFTDAIWKLTGEPIDIYLVTPGEERFEENLRLRQLERKKASLLEERKEIEFPNRAEGFARIFELRDGQLEEHTEPAEPGIVERARAELAEEAREQEARRQKDEVIQKLLRGEIRFLHVCKHCGKQERLTPQEAFDAGWDYPPKMGWFGIISPRTCGNCTIKDTLWWAVTMEDMPSEGLSRTQKETMERILGEPWDLLDESDRSSILREISDDEGKEDPPC